MESEILASYRILINPLSPLHVGTGDTLSRLDFLLDQGWLIVLDERKVLEWIASDQSGRLASDFSHHVVTGGNIRQFLEIHHIDPTALRAYRIENHTLSQRISEVRPFIKTSNYQPYLPGSSIKGALRSSLLRGILLEKEEIRENISNIVQKAADNSKKGPKQNSGSESLEASVFVNSDVPRNKYSNYDLNRVFAIGDSLPKTENHLELIEIKILSARGDSLGDKGFSTYVEALRPHNTKYPISLSMPFTWHTYLLQEKNAASQLNLYQIRKYMLFLPEYCRAASLQLIDQEIHFYHRYGHPLAGWFEDKRTYLQNLPEGYFILPLGWGSGYDAKTVTDMLGTNTFKAVADNFRNTKGIGRAGNSRDNPWLGSELSPKSRKVVLREGSTYEPLGWLLLAFRQGNKSVEDWYDTHRQKDKKQQPVFPPDISRLPQIRPVSSAPPASHTVVPPEQPRTPQELRRPESPPLKQVTELFTALPKPGDRFYGRVFEVTDEAVLLEIPGLDADSLAYAVLKTEDNPLLGRKKENQQVTCEVLALREEHKGYWQVRCRLG